MSRIELDAHDGEDAPFLPIDHHAEEGRPDRTVSLADGLANEPIASSTTSPSQPPSLARRPASWQASSPSTIVILVTAVKFLVVTSGMLILMPIYRLIEDAFCHVHYHDDSPGLIDEMKCKVDEVQSPLAYMMGWFGLVNSVVNLIATYPYGMLADRIGRRPTALLSYGGVALSFSLSPLMLGPWKYSIRQNPYVLLTGSVFTLLGGGIPVLMATLYAIVSDVTTEKDRAASFLYLTMGATAGGLLGPLLAGLLMERWGPWLPITIVCCSVPFVLALFVFIPETLTVKLEAQRPEEEEGPSPSSSQPALVVLRGHIGRGLRDLVRSLRMLRNPNVPLCLVTFFFTSARFTAGSSTLAQYISKHFGWTLAETSVLLSPLGLVHLVVLGALPRLSSMLTSPRFGGLTPFRRDLLLARASLFVLALSALIRGLSPSVGPFLFGLFVGAFGAAESPLVRSVVSGFVDPSHISRLYALAGTAEVLGAFAGPPVLAWCFDRGLRLGGVWAGLPWFYLTLVCLLAWGALLFVRAPKKAWDESEVFDDDEAVGDDVRPRNPVRLE